MFCPSCGSDQPGQYCRACGTDLRTVRTVLDKSPSMISARDEIGRAVADKIRELKSAKELSKVVEEVLPELTKWLESPAEKRLRRIRSGVLASAIGLGAAVGFFLIAVATQNEGLLFPAGAGLTTFLIGLGMLLNGWLFTVPSKQELEPTAELPAALKPLLTPIVPERQFPTSVTDHTTHQLPDHPVRAREAKVK